MAAKSLTAAAVKGASNSRESNLRFPKEIRLRKRHQFQRLNHGCKRQTGNLLILESRLNNAPHSRLGVTVTRRYGDSHERNRFKRIVREAFRLCYQDLPQGYDFNIKPRPLAKHAKTQDIISELVSLLTIKNS
jgi:ribonuclease P protein component